MSKHLEQWDFFKKHVEEHIENYAVAQYGDVDSDNTINDYSEEDIKRELERYVRRIGKKLRGKKEALRDCLKIADYAHFLYRKIYNSETK